MNHSRSAEGGDFVPAGLQIRLGDQREHHELQSGQCSRGGAYDDVEALPRRKMGGQGTVHEFPL